MKKINLSDGLGRRVNYSSAEPSELFYCKPVLLHHKLGNTTKFESNHESMKV